MKSLVVVIVFLFLMKVFAEKAFAATKKKVQIVGIGVISINTDNYGNRRKDALDSIFEWAEALNIDLVQDINLKMRYNETREYHHAGKKY